jgi:RHS repeat-associated protein
VVVEIVKIVNQYQGFFVVLLTLVLVITTIGYDGDGNRIQKTVDGVTTTYLVDTNNLTGYSQVLEEKRGGSLVKVYTYGLDLISCKDIPAAKTYYFGYDGQGSVRYLTDSDGNVTDTYDYDAFGNLLSRTGTTDNNYLYTGEQWDSDLEMYFLRARYMDTDSGRFWGMDSWEGVRNMPVSLHKYLYANANPMTYSDASGNMSLPQVMMSVSTIGILSSAVLTGVGYFAGMEESEGVPSGILISVKGSATWRGVGLGTGVDFLYLANGSFSVFWSPGELAFDLSARSLKGGVSGSFYGAVGPIYNISSQKQFEGVGYSISTSIPFAGTALKLLGTNAPLGFQTMLKQSASLANRAKAIMGVSRPDRAYFQFGLSSSSGMAVGAGGGYTYRLMAAEGNAPVALSYMEKVKSYLTYLGGDLSSPTFLNRAVKEFPLPNISDMRVGF